jgi:hypothetical protein
MGFGVGTERTMGAGETTTGAGTIMVGATTTAPPRQRQPHQASAESTTVRLKPTVSARTAATRYATFILQLHDAGQLTRQD